MVKTFYLRVNNSLEQNTYIYLLNFISDIRKDQIKRFRFYDDALLSLFSELIIRMILTRIRNVPNSEIQFTNDKYGKPFLRDKNLNFHFNVSHTSGLVLCSVDKNPVGVDTEYKKPIGMDIAERFFAKEEYNHLMSLESKAQEDLFYDLWVVKESYLKLTGFGLQKGLDSFSIDRGRGKIISKDDYSVCFFKQYDFFREYALAVCSEKNEFSPELMEIPQQELIDFFIK